MGRSPAKVLQESPTFPPGRDIPATFDNFFVQLRWELDVDDSGPSTYKKLLSLLTAHFDDGDQGRAFEQLNIFGVPDLTEFSTFLRAFKQRFSIVQGTEPVSYTHLTLPTILRV